MRHGARRQPYICDAWRPPLSVGRPCRTTTERQGVVDGALGPANDARDGSAAQTPAGVAARDGQEGLGTTPSGDDCGLAAGLIEAELAAGERIFGVLDANNRRVRRNSPMMSSGTSSCRTHRGGTMRRPGCCCSLGSRAAQLYWLAKCHTQLASAIWRKRQSTQPHAHPQHTATLPHRTSPISQTPQYPIISLVDMRQPYTLTTPYYFFHSKLQTSNFTGTLSRRMHAAKDR